MEKKLSDRVLSMKFMKKSSDHVPSKNEDPVDDDHWRVSKEKLCTYLNGKNLKNMSIDYEDSVNRNEQIIGRRSYQQFNPSLEIKRSEKKPELKAVKPLKRAIESSDEKSKPETQKTKSKSEKSTLNFIKPKLDSDFKKRKL